MCIEVWTLGDADSNMDQRILVRLADRVRRHPWWLSRAKLVRWLLRREGILPHARVLDAGCGWGSTFLSLEQDGYEMTGTDISRQALEYLDAPYRRLALCDLTQSRASEETFDAVLSMDVIEHVDDDAVAIRRMIALVRSGGLLLVSVPALPELYGEFDAIQGHRRRYTERALRDLLESSGLIAVQTLWWGRLAYYLIRYQRSDKKSMPGDTPDETYLRYLALPENPLRWALDAVFWADRWLTRLGICRLGTSLFAIARRP
jgi:SAM-dependent methyltransferase